MCKKEIYITWNWFASFFLWLLLKQDFWQECDIYFSAEKISVLYTCISDFTFSQLSRVLHNIEDLEIFVPFQIEDTSYDFDLQAYVLSTSKVDSIFQSRFRNIKHHNKEYDFFIHASNQDVSYDFQTQNFPYKSFLARPKDSKKVYKNFQSTYNNLPCFWENHIDVYYYLWLWKNKDDIKEKNEYIDFQEFEIIWEYWTFNTLNLSDDKIYIGSGLWMSPLFFWFGIQLTILDGLYTSMYITSWNINYINRLKNYRKYVFTLVDSYLHSGKSFDSYSRHKYVWSYVEKILKHSIKLYITFIQKQKNRKKLWVLQV